MVRLRKHLIFLGLFCFWHKRYFTAVTAVDQLQAEWQVNAGIHYTLAGFNGDIGCPFFTTYDFFLGIH